jgi:hypothetical protein
MILKVCELVLLDEFILSEEQIFQNLWSNIDSCSECREYAKIFQPTHSILQLIEMRHVNLGTKQK